MKKKALIIGVTGQDGGYLAQFLINNQYEVYGSSRDAEASSFVNLKYLNIYEQVIKISLNSNDFRSIYSAIHKINPDEVYNLSGQSSVGLSFEQPVETFESIAVANLNILEALRISNNKDIKFYNAGSSECFGHTDVKVNETSPFSPCSPYAIAKATAFWQIKNYRESYGIHASTGILFNHESPIRPERFVTSKIIRAAYRIKCEQQHALELGNLDIIRDWGFAGEYVQAMWMMLQQEAPSDYIIATGESNSLEDFVSYTFNCLGLNWKNYVIQNKSLLRPSDFKKSLACPIKAEKNLNWKAKFKMKNVIDLLLENLIKSNIKK